MPSIQCFLKEFRASVLLACKRDSQGVNVVLGGRACPIDLQLIEDATKLCRCEARANYRAVQIAIELP
jgi:hypothetical protein